MNRLMQFNPNDTIPERKAVFKHQGIPEGAQVPDNILGLFEKAMEIFTASAQPEGIISDLPIQEFETIFGGEGRNAHDAVLERIYSKADNLALFALTMGGAISEKIGELFKNNDFALGSFLDAAASIAADKAVSLCETYFSSDLSTRESDDYDNAVLSYSPGYCGWDISGQKKLFHFLNPERIGISLNDSFLMSPLKSVTGLLAAGKKEIHIFQDSFSYCRFCKDHTCIERMERLLSK